MPDNNETVFFIDDDLVERLMRGDTEIGHWIPRKVEG